MHTTYILFSEKLQKFYIGFTSGSMLVRLQKHLMNKSGFTSKAKDWKIVFTETFNEKSDAMRREKELKGWKSHVRIKELILRSKFNNE